MASLNARIHSAIKEHRRLLDILNSTEHAPAQLVQQQDLIAALQADIAASDARVASAEALRLAEHAGHAKYRDSTFRRLAHKASGRSSKYSAKVAKEESEHLAAIQAEHAEQQHNDALRSHLSSAQSIAASLQAPAAQHAQAQSDLSALLSSLFDGPTPSHPDEDAAEQRVSLALAAYRSSLTQRTAEASALAHLKTAQLAMHAAVAATKDSVRIAVQLSAFNDRELSDRRARAALATIETQLLAARVAYLQAQRVKPDLEDIPPLEVDQRVVMTALYFADPGLFHREPTEFRALVQALLDRVLEVGLFVKGKVEQGAAGEEELKGVVREREGDLRAARERLVKVREKVFESVAGDL